MSVSSPSIQVGSTATGFEFISARPDWINVVRSRAAAVRRAQANVRREEPLAPQAQSWSGAMRVVGLLAFGQSVIFLVIWLLCCLSAGARTTSPAKASSELSLNLEESTFKPAKARDPFQAVGVVVTTTGEAKPVINDDMFRLQGILFSQSNPSAIVNDKLVSLNRPVSLTTSGGPIEVKAVEITREVVVLEVAGQRKELRLATPKPKAQAATTTPSTKTDTPPESDPK